MLQSMAMPNLTGSFISQLAHDYLRRSSYLFASVQPKLQMFEFSHSELTLSLGRYSLMIRSQCFRAASNPSRNNCLNIKNDSELTPPRTSMYSGGNLNGAASNPMFPGELESIKPKSMWMRCPSRSNRMLPLCRSLICSRYVTRE